MEWKDELGNDVRVGGAGWWLEFGGRWVGREKVCLRIQVV